MELQDDDRTQTFLTQVNSVQDQGKILSFVWPVRLLKYLFVTHLSFVRTGPDWVAHFLSVRACVCV